MDRNQARDYIINHATDYLRRDGGGKGYICPICNDGDARRGQPGQNGITTKDGIHFTCWRGCFKHADIIDIIGQEKGLTGYSEKLEAACKAFNITADEYQKQDRNEQYTHNSIHTSVYTQKEESKDYQEYFAACSERVEETDYFKRRGLSQETISAYNLGFDGNYTKATGGRSWAVAIIPTGKGSYVARNTDSAAGKDYRYRKVGASQIYLKERLWSAQIPVYIVEGEMDALSIIEAGGEAVALGSTSNFRQLLSAVKANKPTQPLVLALDNDSQGRETTETLKQELKKLGVPFYQLDPYGGAKDANEALLADREAFTLAVAEAKLIRDEEQKAEREAYLKKSTIYHLQSFVDGIADSVNTPFIPTGYEKLDKALDGGLYEGLYIIGAISSLGKTTFVMQIADQIAQSGKDVLLFSLEMAREELMAKTISRHTIQLVLENGGDTRNAKTTRGITTGKRYEKYNEKEKELIYQAIADYSVYADRIYIEQGIGDIGVSDIRETVEKHKRFTGKAPVVIVDYLQILAPYNERTSDKQNTDKAVLELKRLSRDYKTPVIAISSFNRENYNEAVSMKAFKESGAVEYGSDVLIGLQLKGAGSKEFDGNKAKKENPRKVELVILKNRNGELADPIEYNFYKLFNYFQEA